MLRHYISLRVTVLLNDIKPHLIIRRKSRRKRIMKSGNRRQSVSFRNALSNSVVRKSLYADAFGRCAFLNPLFSESVHDITHAPAGGEGPSPNFRDFLSSMPSFSDFSDEQLSSLEANAVLRSFEANEIIFKQGEDGDVFYVIHKGSVDVLIQEKHSSLARGDYGVSATRLTEGFFFGERALLTTEPRAATIKALEATQCLVFSRDVFEEVISGSSALIGSGSNDNIDWSKDRETRSLFQHVEKIIEIDNDTRTKARIRNILYELSTAFTPELTPDEIVSRMVMTIKASLQTDRVGLFILTEDKENMILKVSERCATCFTTIHTHMIISVVLRQVQRYPSACPWLGWRRCRDERVHERG